MSQTLVAGVGELHLEVIASKLKSKFGSGIIFKEPKIPYRETIRKPVDAEGKHKKQTGGHGQYGHVWIDFEPIGDVSVPFEFVDKIVGGVVPRQYIPAVEKGLKNACKKVFLQVTRWLVLGRLYMMVHIIVLTLRRWHLKWLQLWHIESSQKGTPYY